MVTISYVYIFRHRTREGKRCEKQEYKISRLKRALGSFIVVV